jgi:formate C-acetyltransferase
MQKHGYSLREAQTADIKGCYEYCAPNGTVETAPVTVNAAKVIGLVMHNGVEVLSGKKIGIATGELASFKNFKQFYRAFLRQLFYQFDRSVEFIMRTEKYLDEINPALFISGTFESSLRQAVDGYAKGAKYNNSNLWICGAATAADSLTVIKRYVFERKEFSLTELAGILDRDFEGHELLRQKLLHDPEKYGNNLELPDRIALHFTGAVARRFNGKPNSRGGFFTTSLHASNRFFEWADKVEATPDGRKQGDELNKNMTASQGCAFNGATALVASVLKFDSSLFMGDLPVDIMLHPSEVKGENGLKAMQALLMTFIKNYGHAMQFNVMDTEVLKKAQLEPEKYRHLQVRICGWNMLWNSISRKEQDAYIRQAERL